MPQDAIRLPRHCAKCRLADEYDAAQERGEVKKHGRRKSDIPNENITPDVTDIGLTSKQVHEARRGNVHVVAGELLAISRCS
jgi:hypothetical protein